MRYQRCVTSCGAIVLVLVVTGCGSSSNSGPTKAQYVAKVDAICKSAGSKTAPLVSKVVAGGASLASGSARAAHELAPVLQQLHATGAASIAQLRALKQPIGESSKIEGFLSPLTNVVAAVGQAASSLSAGQPSGALGLLAQVESDAQQTMSAAQAYGVAACGSVLSALG